MDNINAHVQPMQRYYIAVISLLVLAACSNGNVKNKDSEPQDSVEVAVCSDDSDDEGAGTDDDRHVCVSEDGRITIESGIVPGGGTAPDYWARWTVIDKDGGKHVIMSPETSYQDKVNTITKTDGTVYYIVNCYGKASSSDGYEWLQAYKIVGDTIQEVNVADGGCNVSNDEFSVNYNIPSWYFATNGAGYDWILEYDIHTRDLYVPITTEEGIIVDRYKVWHFDGNRFVCQGESPHKNLHKSLTNYKTLICYATTKDYVLRIDALDDGELRYASWKKPKTMADMPDIIIGNGKKQHYEVASDELCPCDDYRFYNGSFEYVVNYCEVKELEDGYGEHHDFLLVKRNGKVMTKQKLD